VIYRSCAASGVFAGVCS